MKFGSLNLTTRPLAETIWPIPRVTSRQPAKFRAPWDDTLGRLRNELAHFKPERVVLYMDIPAGMIRGDGMPRADARAASPAVLLAIETAPTLWLRFPCETYSFWQDNVRAIALTLKALRDVDRWGVMKGEQYEGMKALPARALGGTSDGIHSPRDAALFVAEHATGNERPDEALVRSILGSPDVRRTYALRASRKLHPDAKTGSEDMYHRLTRALRMLELNQGAVTG